MPPRKPGSVILANNQYEDLMNDVKEFLNAEEWYRERGIPWRRGYLLYGVPGCGKTSFVTALAGELGLNICMLDLNNTHMDDGKLNTALHMVPANTVILIEDIDAVFKDRLSVQDVNSGQQHVTFSGLLNALDGVGSQEGRVLFMST